MGAEVALMGEGPKIWRKFLKMTFFLEIRPKMGGPKNLDGGEAARGGGLKFLGKISKSLHPPSHS